jgi:hypothetical protein
MTDAPLPHPPVLLLSTLGDGPYWTSALEILGPPARISFYREFNYRTAWAGDDVLELLPVDGASIQASAILGMRFRQEDGSGSANRFIPLRGATVTLTRDGEIAADLVLGEYVRLDDSTGDFCQLAMTPELGIKNGDPVLARLVSPDETAEILSWQRSRTPDSRLWSRLSGSPLIPEPVRDRLRDRIVLYCTGANDPKDRSQIEPAPFSKTSHAMWRYSLTVGRTYDFDLHMRRIGSAGQDAFAEAPDFELITDPLVVAASTRVVPFTGNYRQVPVWIRPLMHQPIPLHLWWHPREAKTSPTTNRPINVGLRVPFTARRKFPYVGFVAALSFLTAGAIALTRAAGLDENSRNAASATVAAATVLVSIGSALLLRAIDVWGRQS